MFILGHILNAVAVIIGHVLWLYSLVVMVAVLTWRSSSMVLAS